MEYLLMVVIAGLIAGAIYQLALKIENRNKKS